MRSDRLYLEDIIAAADAIQRFIAEIVGESAFHDDELRQSAVLQKLIVIGEAATRLSPELRSQSSPIDWPDIVAFRNIAVHAYFSIDWSIVWVTAQDDVPKLRAQVQTILNQLDANFDLPEII
ncbi:HepT-like ribonuclease domain-containing protein [Caldilinea sp.]|uniref:HepT-like ribonuclease domain-containing protein n=1 Tax=Caldilinea sp. TaxID=2293560 RepID=UPI002B7BE83E|nr:DUF86 domain-containing protein [Caldilinea sp.]HRA66575.1 DUF86 domain-containing protein [Caldilinea sp.]